MQGKIEADLTNMSTANLIVLFVGISVLLIVVTVIIIVTITKLKKLGIKNFGPLEVEHNNMSTMYEMNDKINDIDNTCHNQMKYITERMKIHISNVFAEMNICVPTRVSISSAIRSPLYESISNNHFTAELMPDRYTTYRERIIETIKDEYVSLAATNKNEQCSRDKLPTWDAVIPDDSGKKATMNERLTECVDIWLKRIAKEVMNACEKKIVIYKQYLRMFEESKDDFRINICRECIEKNEHYIREIKHLLHID